MCPASEWADMLQELRASASKYTPGDFGREGTYEEIVPEFTCYGRKLKSSEKVVAGVEAATISYAVYADLPLHPELTEAVTLDLAGGDGAELGRFDTRSIVPYPSESMAMLEVDKLSTQ